MKKKIKWGIVGTARISETALIPAINKSKNSELVAVGSRNKITATNFAKKHKIKKAYGSYKKLFEDKDIDVIYNPLPNHLHLKTTIEACNNNKNVLLEKPITLKASDVDLIKNKAKQNKTIVKEAFMVRHHPQWQWIKNYIKSNKIGTVKAISSFFSYNNTDPKNIRNVKKFGGGGLYDIGCYPIVISRYLLDKEPIKVIGDAKFDKKFKTDILTSAILDFDGVYSNFVVSTNSALIQQVFIIGSKKSICIENPFNAKSNKNSTIIIYQGKSIYKKENIIKIFSKVDQYEKQVTDFSNHLLKNTPVLFNLNDSKKNMKVIDSIFKSIKTKKWVNV
jgi:predicted dehydrogenase